MHFGYTIGYSPSEMQAGLTGLKDTLRALAAANEAGGEGTGGTAMLSDREDWFLYLDLDWPEIVKRVGAIKFDRSWEKEEFGSFLHR